MLLRIESCRFAVEFFRNLPVVLSFHTLVMILTSEPLVLSSTIRRFERNWWNMLPLKNGPVSSLFSQEKPLVPKVLRWHANIITVQKITVNFLTIRCRLAVENAALANALTSMINVLHKSKLWINLFQGSTFFCISMSVLRNTHAEEDQKHKVLRGYTWTKHANIYKQFNIH